MRSKSCEIIGKKCREAREKNGLSQEQVARAIGVTWRTYQRFEVGEGHSTKCLDWCLDNLGVKL